MEPLTWTGSLSFLNPIFMLAWIVFGLAVIAQILLSFVSPDPEMQGGALAAKRTPMEYAGMVVKAAFGIIIALVLVYLIGGVVIPGYENKGIIGTISSRFLPVWIALVATFAVSITYKRRLGLYGKLFDSIVGMIGFAIVMFWVFTGIFGAMDLIVTHDPLAQVSGLKNKVPGTAAPDGSDIYPYYLLGGDNLARDVFSRMVKGSWEVIKIAPLPRFLPLWLASRLGCLPHTMAVNWILSLAFWQT